MNENELIRRGDALKFVEVGADWWGAYAAIAALPAAPLDAPKHLTDALDAVLNGYTPGIDRAVRFVSIDQVDMLAEFYLNQRKDRG
jgi:hypothetical protein